MRGNAFDENTKQNDRREQRERTSVLRPYPTGHEHARETLRDAEGPDGVRRAVVPDVRMSVTLADTRRAVCFFFLFNFLNIFY